MNLNDIAKSYHDEDSARAFLEGQRWPDGQAACPHCGEIGRSYRLEPKEGAKTHVRKGVWKCGACRKQFTVTVGTISPDVCANRVGNTVAVTWLVPVEMGICCMTWCCVNMMSGSPLPDVTYVTTAVTEA